MIATTQPETVLALKALWRSNDRLSSCAPLAGKLKALDAAKAGADPITANYIGQGYTLPEGWTFQRLADHRAAWDIAPHMVPVAVTPGCCVGWGTPMLNGEYLRHPGNV